MEQDDAVIEEVVDVRLPIEDDEGEWTGSDDGMDVDDAVMQKFLESSDKFKSQFSVQDMLDGKIRAEDPLGDLLARDDRGRRARGGNDAL